MLANYLVVAYKVLLRRKFFAFVSLFAVTVTLVVLTVCAAVVDHGFGPVPPETRADRTLYVFGARLEGERNVVSAGPGYGLLDRYERDLPGVERMSIVGGAAVRQVYRDAGRVSLHVKRTDADFWRILEFRFLEGGPFTADDDRDGNRVAVISDATRRSLFDGAPAVGRTVDLDGATYRVVGVVPDVPADRIVPYADVWVPFGSALADSERRELVGDCTGILLARSASDFPGIKQEYAARLATVEITDPRQFSRVASVPGTLFEFIESQMFGTGDGRGTGAKLGGLLVLLALLFMLLPAINLVNLNVSRILERASEIGVRKAFGASSAALVGQFLVENVAVTLVGGLVAFVVSWALLRALSASGLVANADFTVNGRVFGYGLACALVFGVVSGVYPAWKMSRLDPVRALKGGLR